MIQFQLENVNSLWKELDSKKLGISEIMSAQSKNEIAKAVFTITSKRFLKDFAVAAAANPKKYHHVFEWGKNYPQRFGKVGKLNDKLFEIKRGRLNQGDVEIIFKYLKSQQPVPVPTALLMPGRKGKRVTRRSVFTNKAEMMELGAPLTFTTKRWIVYLSEGGEGKKVFIPKGRAVQIVNPGGRYTTGAFYNYVDRWYIKKVDSTLRSSGLFKQIGKAVATTLNKKGAGPIQARQAIKTVAESYSQGMDKF